MRIIGIILLPVTFIYSLVIRLKNHLYNIGYSRSFQFEIPIILTGNLSAGGAGKTPMVEYFVRLLIDKYGLAILSRGYKRESKGFYLASGDESYRTLGDEPLQMYRKWGNKISVIVCKDRVEAIPKILFEKPGTQVVLMDDGYQHRAISPDLKVLLTDYQKPFYKDFLLPSGWLREPRKEARRADVIVVTKCTKDLSDQEMKSFKEKIKKYTRPETPVFFSFIDYEDPSPLFEGVPDETSGNIIVVSGIANPSHFENYIASKWNVVNSRHYPDHYVYKPADLKMIRESWESHSSNQPAIFTTEKDAVKFTDPEIAPMLEGLPVYVIPIKMQFLKNGLEFDALIKQAVESKAGF